jgi:dTDP-4-dehydrorhamnose reductase
VNNKGFTLVHEKILIMGATGLLGSVLVPFFKTAGIDVATQGRSHDVDFLVDLTDEKAVSTLLLEVKPQTIINLVGLTSVDRCEESLDLAYQVNTRTVENIVSVLTRVKSNAHLIQISTDQIYDGRGIKSENNVTMSNNYAITKYAGELAAANIQSTILRTNFFGRSRLPERKSLTDWIFNSLKNGERIQVFDDVLFSPLSMRSLAKIVMLVAQKKPFGIYNAGSRNGFSKADFAFEFAKSVDLPIDVMSRVHSSQVKSLKAYRPKDMRMDSSKLEKKLGIQFPDLTGEIKCVAKEYDEIM